MKPVPHLNFLRLTPRPWGGVVLALAAAGVLAAISWHGWELERGNREEASMLARRTVAAAPLPPRKLTEAERVRFAQASAVAGELGAPWSDLLAAFEEHGSGDVGLLKLEPDARAGLVRVTAQVRNTRALFAYVRALEADPRLDRVVLTNHQIERDTPGMPLRFTLQAGWRRGPAVGGAVDGAVRDAVRSAAGKDLS
jgi:hypothetical protein